jgi:pantothenate kinase-related protein Tda10
MAMEKWNDADERIQELIDNNRCIINELLYFIMLVAEQRQRFGKSVVGISGAGCLGKSTLAQAMAVCFKDEYHIPATYEAELRQLDQEEVLNRDLDMLRRLKTEVEALEDAVGELK